VKILEGKAAQVAAGIRRRATTFGYSPAEPEGADAYAGYLTAKKPYLDYATALAKGWPIATGVIEGACRHLVKDRMDITGARWGPDGAEAILKLRALIANGDFEPYWRFHLRQEHKRIHRLGPRRTLAARAAQGQAFTLGTFSTGPISAHQHVTRPRLILQRRPGTCGCSRI
jgi:hypothetical protein